MKENHKLIRFLKENHMYAKFVQDKVVVKFKVRTLEGLNLLLEEIDLSMDDVLEVQLLRAEETLADKCVTHVQFNVFMSEEKPTMWLVGGFSGTWEKCTNDFSDFVKDVKVKFIQVAPYEKTV
jgi:hypothetical protein